VVKYLCLRLDSKIEYIKVIILRNVEVNKMIFLKNSNFQEFLLLCTNIRGGGGCHPNTA
jgi:hypothetical protein